MIPTQFPAPVDRSQVGYPRPGARGYPVLPNPSSACDPSSQRTQTTAFRLRSSSFAFVRPTQPFRCPVRAAVQTQTFDVPSTFAFVELTQITQVPCPGAAAAGWTQFPVPS